MKKLFSSYTTRDIMILAALIAVGGVTKAYWAQVRVVVESVMGPYAGVIIGPGFYFWAILAAVLVPKPGSATISMVLGGIVEIMAGNPFGLPVLAFNFWEGLGPDVIYYLRKYKATLFTSILAGLAASFLGVFYGWYYFGFSYLGFTAFAWYLVTKAGAGLIAGVVGHYGARAVQALGVTPDTAKVLVE